VTDTTIQPWRSPRFQELEFGAELPGLTRGPITPVHLMRWSAAIENWHRIHYDAPFAVEHDGLPGLLINGSWKQHFLVQLMTDWLGPDGWLTRIDFQFRQMNLVGETLHAHGVITKLSEQDGIGIVECRIGIRNEAGVESTPGTAVGVLPLDEERGVPYPFALQG
jgi:acyl dehydratase